MSQTTIALIGIMASLVAVFSEARSRNQQEVNRDADYWRQSSHVLAQQLQASQQRALIAEDKADRALDRAEKLEESLEKLKQWALEYVNKPSDDEEDDEELEGPKGFLRSLWDLIW